MAHCVCSGILFQYPLKEVVVVNEDEEFLRDVDYLRSYILEVIINQA